MSRAAAAAATLAAALLVLAAAVLAAGGGNGGAEPTAPGEEAPRPAEQPESALPAPREPIPRDATRLARTLTETTRELNAAIDDWTAEGTDRGASPRAVTLLALHQQRIYLLLGARERLADATLERLPTTVRRRASDVLAARRALQVLNPPTRGRRRFTTGPALPAGRLLELYRQAERRFGVEWELLAAVNFVETGFNKIRSNSTAGAQGPMQFIPSTWAAYGMGGNIRDPRDAIMGAANYLRASGAPGDNRGALFAYNPSSLYVTAVQRYARRIRLDRREFYAFYSWQIFVRTPSGSRRLTGPRPL